MFTGIVEEIGTVVATEPTDGGRRIEIGAAVVAADLSTGGSVAIDGACLTAVAVQDGAFTVEAVPETMARTTLGRAEVGTRLNLERAMAATGRFDGHIVQGHVDGIGTIVEVRPEGDGRRLTVQPPDNVLGYLVEKGSVTVDGISLTVAAVDARRFSVALIPHTLTVTTIGERATGDVVNLEVDILAKYVQRMLEM